MVNESNGILSPDTRILIVDDSVDYAKVLSRLLQNGMGYNSVVALSSVEQAFEVISEAPDQFSVLFIDYHFPNGQTGRDLVQKLEENRLLDGKVTFFITAEPAVQKALEATESGIRGVVVKPFSREQLRIQLERVDRHLRADSRCQSE